MTNCSYLMEPTRIKFPSPIEEPETSMIIYKRNNLAGEKANIDRRPWRSAYFMQLAVVVSRIGRRAALHRRIEPAGTKLLCQRDLQEQSG